MQIIHVTVRWKRLGSWLCHKGGLVYLLSRQLGHPKFQGLCTAAAKMLAQESCAAPSPWLWGLRRFVPLHLQVDKQQEAGPS